MLCHYNGNHDKLVFMDVRHAEPTSDPASARLAIKISLMNELANIAERLGVDIDNVRSGVRSASRLAISLSGRVVDTMAHAVPSTWRQ